MHSKPYHSLMNRRGFVLLVVLVVVVLLSLGTYRYLNQMTIEHLAVSQFARQVEADCAAKSGAEFFAVQLATDRRGEGFSLEDVQTNLAGGHRAVLAHEFKFRIRAADPNGHPVDVPVDEASRLDINELVRWYGSSALRQAGGYPTNPLTYVPGITTEIADNVMDWIDTDEVSGANGAESDLYASLGLQGCPNRPLVSVSELKNVFGMNEKLLFGEDRNHNGVLDDSEDDGADSLPNDNANGRLDADLSQFLTVHSFQDNYDRSLNRRFLVSSMNIEQLFVLLIAKGGFSKEESRFIAAYRYNGSAGTQRIPSGVNVFARSLDGLSQETPPLYHIRSISDLIDSEVIARISGGPNQRLVSPFRSTGSEESLDLLLDRLTLTAADVLRGRININAASVTVLQMIPFMTQTMAERIIQARAKRTARSDGVAWLLTDNVLTLKEFRGIEPFITGKGHIFRFVSTGYDDVRRIRENKSVVVDVRWGQPQFRYFADIKFRSVVIPGAAHGAGPVNSNVPSGNTN